MAENGEGGGRGAGAARRADEMRRQEEFTELAEWRIEDWRNRRSDSIENASAGHAVSHDGGGNEDVDDDGGLDQSLDSVLKEVEAQLDDNETHDTYDEDNDNDDDAESFVDDDATKNAEWDAYEEEEEEEREANENTCKKIPPHACAYCRIHEPSCVIKCLDCEKSGGKAKWFCNGHPRGSGYSCIVQHLVRARHKAVQLHPSSPLGETVLECYSSGNKNVFQLGFVPAKTENVVILLTRDVCLNRSQLEEMSWNPDEWMPLIKDGEFRDWLVKIPSEKDSLRARHITKEQIIKLEELWKKEPDADLEDLDREDGDASIVHVLPQYEDGFQYQNIFGPLVKMEADEDKHMKESFSQEGVTLEQWYRGLSKKLVAEILVECGDGAELRFVPGDELRLKRLMGSGETWEGVGTVRRISGNSVHLEMRSNKKVPERHLDRYSLEYVWRSVTFDRMQAAMRTFALDDDSVSQYIFHQLLGHRVVPQTLQTKMPKRFSVPGLPDLNHSQAEAVKAVLESPMALIQGPPGTGKTFTSAAILYHLARQKGIGQILVCAPSNVAVDQLAEKIHKTGIRVVRVAARTREEIEGNVEHLCLHNMVRELATASGGNARGRRSRSRNDLKKLFLLKETVGELSPRDDRKFRKLVRASEQELLKNAQIICTTCVGAGDPRLRKTRFRTVLIDEATQATEPECLIPIVRGCRRLIIVGDHCQLGPVVTCKAAARAGLSQSLYERLIVLGKRPIRLEVQYRMHPALSEFPSNTFYDGSLQNGTTDAERVLKDVDFPWPRDACPMFFYCIAGVEEMGASGTSFLNRAEAAAVERIVSSLLKGGCTPDQIGVITPYEGQRSFIESHIERNGALASSLYREIEIASVDSFQGREKDLIIISCVRSNERQGIGFLSDPRRLNVALTRAKYGVIIVGNPHVLCRHPLWNNLLVHFKERDVLVEGPLNNLKISRIKFKRARPYYNRRRYQMLAHAHRAMMSGGDYADGGRGLDSNMMMMLSSLPAYPGGPSMHDMFREGPEHGMLDPRSMGSAAMFDPRYMQAMSTSGSDIYSAGAMSETASVCSQDSSVFPPSVCSQDSFAFPHGRLSAAATKAGDEK